MAKRLHTPARGSVPVQAPGRGEHPVLECTRCKLAAFRRHRVTGRGPQPADILFVGEAPGRSEDLVGQPFIGPSGRLLDQLLADAFNLVGLAPGSLTYRITNVVQCRPTDSWAGPNRAPNLDEIETCRQNLLAEYALASPRQVVCVGKVPYTALKSVWPSCAKIEHPAYLLRLGGTSCAQYRATVRNLSEILRIVAEEAAADAMGI